MAATRLLSISFYYLPCCSLSSTSKTAAITASKFHFSSQITTIRGLSHCAKIRVSSSTSTRISQKKEKKKKKREEKRDETVKATNKTSVESSVKKRTRSEREFNWEHLQRYGSDTSHIPVMLGEVLEVFATAGSQRPPLHTFVDCTVGAAGHSSAIIQAHSELQLYIGLDIDPVAHKKAQAQINAILNDESCGGGSDFKAYTLLKNFRDIKTVLGEIDGKPLNHGVDGILMDLGMSSMQVNNAERGFSVLSNGPLDMRMNPQATLRAEDILNCWPEDEVGRILREYGEESNWYYLLRKIVKARLGGGLHSTGELVDLIRRTSPRSGGRQGWIKTTTRVFQALRIAVNDELKTLEEALLACFDCLSPLGRLAVISFHSLEDRIVKQTFLDIINREDEDGRRFIDLKKETNKNEEETWIKQRIEGRNGIILTKRPITPCEEEERLNRRCRSAKLRVIQKI